ncbi:MAG: hypothetical protein N3F07_02410 [Candidatus Micrarchaeota archaeon]|nr:hypothetical protein [Candidatus Micrarchaeota archaeon]
MGDASIPAASRCSIGQAAVEVISYSVLFLLMLLLSIAIFFYLQSQEIAKAENAYAQQIAYQLSDQINVAFVAGDGFWHTVRIPPDLLGKNYQFMVSRAYGQQAQNETGFVYVNWNSGKSSVSAPAITASFGISSLGSGIGYSGDFIEINSTVSCLNISNQAGNITFGRAASC